jgi:PKD repeat protein
VDWGDGTIETFVLDRDNPKLKTAHRYLSAGQFTVKLTVFDADGGQNEETRIVTVDDLK